jgi:hypothetical protein
MNGHLLPRWVLVVSAGELAGFVFPVIAGVLWVERPWGVVAVIAAGAVEGAILGLAQWSVMRDAVPELRPWAWVGATAAGAVAAYILGFVPSSTAGVWTTWPLGIQLLVGVPLAGALLLTIGVAQWIVLRRFMWHAWWWIIGSAFGWLAGLAIFFAVAPPLWNEGQPVGLTVLIGLVAGALMAIAMAAVTGVTWIRLVRAQRRRTSFAEAALATG